MAQQQLKTASAIEKLDPVWAQDPRPRPRTWCGASPRSAVHLFLDPAPRRAGSRGGASRQRAARPRRRVGRTDPAGLCRCAGGPAATRRGVPRRHRGGVSIAIPPPTASSSRCSTTRASTPFKPTDLRTGSGTKGRKDFAYYLQSRSSAVFQCDIHPAAKVGRGIFLDHATGLVVGETATIGDDVSMLHDVTLGGTGKDHGDRHPKIATAC